MFEMILNGGADRGEVFEGLEIPITGLEHSRLEEGNHY